MGLFGLIKKKDKKQPTEKDNKKKTNSGKQSASASPVNGSSDTNVSVENNGPETNQYGDTIISSTEFDNLVRQYGCSVNQYNNLLIATDYRVFTCSGMSICNDDISFTFNGVRRNYTTRDGLKALLFIGNNVYAVYGSKPNFSMNGNTGHVFGISGNLNSGNQSSNSGNVYNVNSGNSYNSGQNCIVGGTSGSINVAGNINQQNSYSNEDEEEYDDEDYDEEYEDNEELENESAPSTDLSSVNTIIINSGTADIILESESVNGYQPNVYCNDQLDVYTINNGVLTIDASSVSNPVTIVLPDDGEEIISIAITSISGDIEISEIKAENVSASSTSGDLNINVTTKKLVCSSVSGDLDIYHNYQNNGSGIFSSVSGDIQYHVSGVKRMKLIAPASCDNEFEGDEDGYNASVNISTVSGDVTIDNI